MEAYRGQHHLKEPKTRLSNSSLVLIGYTTAFFPRLLTYFGFPSLLNFFHLGVVPIIFLITLFKGRSKERIQLRLVQECLLGMGLVLILMSASAILNFAGIINVVIQYILLMEPYMLLISIIVIPFSTHTLTKFKAWVLGFALFNMMLAIAQYFLIPIGLFPGSDQLLADNTAGVFVSQGGSAGNYISCTVSIYFSLYYFNQYSQISIWTRGLFFVLAIFQTQISDSKQVFLAMIAGWLALSLVSIKDVKKTFILICSLIFTIGIFIWCLYNLEGAYFDHYRNWTINREGLYGPDGIATQTKLAAFYIIPTHFTHPCNWLLGLGPGHTVTWFGGWLLAKYADLLIPLGGTMHPASSEVFSVISEGWIAQQSTVYFPLFTWAGIWGDLGILGLGSYIFLGSIIWRRICFNNFMYFLILSTVFFGFIITQMEEPGHMLTVAVLLGICWQEKRLEQG